MDGGRGVIDAAATKEKKEMSRRLADTKLWEAAFLAALATGLILLAICLSSPHRCEDEPEREQAAELFPA